MNSIELVSSTANPIILEQYSFEGSEVISEKKMVEKYSHDGVMHLMTVEMEGSMKHGKAELVNENGCCVASLTYSNGKLTGPCTLYTNDGIKRFEGSLLDGEKNGHCREYNQQGEEIFDGEYKDGKRIAYFEEHPDKQGFYIERSREDLHVVAYCEYNLKKMVRNGVCYFLNSSGKVIKEVMMSNGEEVRVKKVFEGDAMIEYGDDGNIIYDGCYNGDWKSGFQRHGHGIEYAGNSNEKASSRIIYEGEFVNGERDCTFSRIQSGILCGYYNEMTRDGKIKSISQLQSYTFVKHGRSIEFSLETKLPTSEKWFEKGQFVYERIHIDGMVMNEYDEGGNLLYMGDFVYGEGIFYRYGEGKEYDGNNKVIQYRGEFVNGCYEGKGTLYRNGRAYFKGNWKSGYPEGEGSLFDENGDVKLNGVWHLGYLNGINYLTGNDDMKDISSRWVSSLDKRSKIFLAFLIISLVLLIIYLCITDPLFVICMYFLGFLFVCALLLIFVWTELCKIICN